MKRSLLLPIFMMLSMWILFIFQITYNIDFSFLAIQPRNTQTLFCIFTTPLVHGNWEHLLSNTPPILFLSLLLYISYEKIATKVWVLNYIITGILVWLFGRDAYHIGASGIVYGLASFLLFSGFFRMDVKAIAIASGIALFYGSMVWGLLPLQKNISWESHIAGGITGFVLSFIFRNKFQDEIHKDYENNRTDRRTFDDFLKK